MFVGLYNNNTTSYGGVLTSNMVNASTQAFIQGGSTTGLCHGQAEGNAS